MLDSCKFQGFVAKFSRYLPLSVIRPPRPRERGVAEVYGSYWGCNWITVAEESRGPY